jgi:hypothetical protein
MKKTLTTHEIAEELYGAGFTYSAADALAEHLEQLEEDLGQEMELDAVEIRCDYSEFTSFQDWAQDYFGDSWKDDIGIDEDEEDEDEIDEEIKDYLNDNSEFIEFDGGIVVRDF